MLCSRKGADCYALSVYISLNDGYFADGCVLPVSFVLSSSFCTLSVFPQSLNWKTVVVDLPSEIRSAFVLHVKEMRRFAVEVSQYSLALGTSLRVCHPGLHPFVDNSYTHFLWPTADIFCIFFLVVTQPPRIS